MAKKNKLGDQVVDDFDNFFYDAFNKLVKETTSLLSSTEVVERYGLPAYTGYFASSWTAGYTRPSSNKESADESQKNRSKEFPWSSVYRKEYSNPRIEPRFLDRVLSRDFDPSRTVYIGNKVNYAAYALEKGSVQVFVQGKLGEVVKKVFKEKGKGSIFVGSKMRYPGKDQIGYQQIL